jgi:hypothetical protein
MSDQPRKNKYRLATTKSNNETPRSLSGGSSNRASAELADCDADLHARETLVQELFGNHLDPLVL